LGGTDAGFLEGLIVKAGHRASRTTKVEGAARAGAVEIELEAVRQKVPTLDMYIHLKIYLS
jgi:hypothetical protein